MCNTCIQSINSFLTGPGTICISRYNKSLANIPKLLELCDILHVYDNSLRKIIRIIRKHKEELAMFPNDIWDEEKIIALMEGRFVG